MHSQCFFSILPFPHLYSSASGNHKPDLFTIRLLVCFFSMLLLLSRFSRVQVCATPEMAAHQAPLSPGFSRQEHPSGLPFPSPMHESEKWKVELPSVSDSSWPHGVQRTRLLRPWDSKFINIFQGVRKVGFFLIPICLVVVLLFPLNTRVNLELG